MSYVVVVVILLMGGVISWISYLIFLTRLVDRHGTAVLRYLPAAVRVYLSAGAVAWAEAVAEMFQHRRRG